MFEQIVQAIKDYPYLGAALLFLLCGCGLPLPEEIILIASGFVVAEWSERVALHWMMVWCAGAILAGDLIPFTLGRVFGTRLLRLRPMRMLVTKQRLANFDRWFRRRGDLVIFIARFLAGIRVVAFFTAGTLKMHLPRFLLLDGLGIVLTTPLLVWLGYRGHDAIQHVVLEVQKVERSILWAVVAALALMLLWFWLWRRRRNRQRWLRTPSETYVEPQQPIAADGTPETPPPATPAAPLPPPPPGAAPPTP